MRTAVVALVLASFSVALAADPAKTHTGLEKTKHFDIRYRPDSRAGAAVDRVAVLAERDFADMCRQLEFTPDGRFTIYLHDDVAEVASFFGPGVGGASYDRTTNIPFDNDQTRYHELAHLVTVRLPKTGDEPRNMFFPDGMANALLTYVHGVHVHAVAKFYRMRKKLPPLEEMAEGDFYAWLAAQKGFNGYDVAASWLRYLIDTYGVAKVKRYYTGTTPRKAFGAGRDKIEKAWHKALDAFEMRKEVEILLGQRNGEYVQFGPIPADILGKESDWRSLMKEKLAPRDGTKWTAGGDGISAGGAGGWHVCALGTKKYGDCAVRAKIRTAGKFIGVQLQLGDKAAAMLNWDALYVWTGDTTGASARIDRKRLPVDAEIDLLIVRRENRLEVYVDGHRAAAGLVDAAAHTIGIGFHSGSKVTFSEVRVREVK
jgi:hypothetical protein